MTSLNNLLLKKLSSEISTSLTTDSYKDSLNKSDFAKRCGLEPFSDEGSFAALVGTHKDLPNVVIKVIPNYDMFLPFAEGVMEGRYKHQWLPDIYGVTRLDTHSIVTVELIPEPLEDKKAYKIKEDFKNCIEQSDSALSEEELSFKRVVLRFLKENKESKTDFHYKNIRTREDGTNVVIDPFFSNQRSATGNYSEKVSSISLST